MNHTVIAVYDTHPQAEGTFAELTRRGFSSDIARMLPADNTPQARQAALREIGKFEDMQEDEGWSLAGFFRSLFGRDENDEHPHIYAEALRRGNHLVLVLADSDQKSDQATEIMNTFSPIDIEERRTRWTREGWTRFDRGAPALSETEMERERAAYTQAPKTPPAPKVQKGQQKTQATAIPVIQEELRVGKRVVQRGGVRIFQHVTERPVEESVTLQEEHVVVERHPVNQPASAADMAAFKEGTVELRESVEEPVVEKTARVVEEVVVGKEVTQHTEKIKDTVRRTDVEVESMGTRSGNGGMAKEDPEYRKHWQSAFGKSGIAYEEVQPAYQYGATLANDPRFRGRGWGEVETNARRDWETSHAGHPWERFKDAVRYGWEKVAH